MKVYNLGMGFLIGCILVGCKPQRPSIQHLRVSEDKETCLENVREASEPSVLEKGLVRVEVTAQEYSYRMPWQKVTPESREGLGTYLSNGYILVTASLVVDATYISIQNLEKTKTTTAEVQAIDYGANLALLKVNQTQFLEGMNPLDIASLDHKGEKVNLCQINASGDIVLTNSYVQNFEMGASLVPTKPVLMYNVKTLIPSLPNSATFPVFSGNKLSGITAFSNDKGCRVIDARTIKTFLSKSSNGGTVSIVPSLGVEGSPTSDPVFRKYLGLSQEGGGIYISKVEYQSNADLAGVKQGDVLVSINGHDIDKLGFVDMRKLGRLNLSYVCAQQIQKSSEIEATLIRDGKKIKKVISLLSHEKSNEDRLLPEYLYDTKPSFIVYGGGVFVELSEPLMRVFGKNVPTSMLKVSVDQDLYKKQGYRHVVVFLGGLPTPTMEGYTQLNMPVVTKVDDKPIHDLKDLAEALDHPQSDIQTIELSQMPYKIQISNSACQQVNIALEQGGLSPLRRLSGK